jgi:hypothetical protein
MKLTQPQGLPKEVIAQEMKFEGQKVQRLEQAAKTLNRTLEGRLLSTVRTIRIGLAVLHPGTRDVVYYSTVPADIDAEEVLRITGYRTISQYHWKGCECDTPEVERQPSMTKGPFQDGATYLIE